MAHRELTAVSMTRKLMSVALRGSAMNAAIDHPDRQASVPTAPFLAADVGGTHARVALVRAAPDEGHGVEVLAYRKFACADFPGLAELLQAFIDGDAPARAPVRHCVLACAGQVVGDEVLNDNLAWPIRLPQLRLALALDDIAVLNDFEALGYALDGPLAQGGRHLCGPDAHAHGPILVVGPGTGLGAAVHVPGPAGHTLYAATKAYLIKFSQSLALENHAVGVNVCALCPGFTWSEFHDVTRTRDKMDKMPGFMWLSAEDVVRQGIAAVERGDAVYIPGRVNRTIKTIVQLMPDRLAMWLSARESKRYRNTSV